MFRVDVKDSIRLRAKGLVEPIIPVMKGMGIERFYVGGNALNPYPYRDIDLFPAVCYFSMAKLADCPVLEIVDDTRNAITARYADRIYQFCNHLHVDLKWLVESFDFAHVQVGASVHIVGGFTGWYIDEVYYTSNWSKARECNRTWYVMPTDLQMAFPLSSLLRLSKYMHRPGEPEPMEIASALTILNAILKRGFRDYEDFKDQLDAVDLGLLPSQLDELDLPELTELFCKLGPQDAKEGF